MALLIVLHSECIQQAYNPCASQHPERRERYLCSHYCGSGMVSKAPSHIPHNAQRGVRDVGMNKKLHSAKLSSCWSRSYVFFTTPFTFPHTAHCFFTWPSPISPLRSKSEFISSFSCCTHFNAAVEAEDWMMRKNLGKNWLGSLNLTIEINNDRKRCLLLAWIFLREKGLIGVEK